MTTRPSAPSRYLLWTLITVGILAISTASLFIRMAEEAPPLTIAAFRVTVATFILAPWAGARRLFSPLPLTPVPRVALGTTLLAGTFLAFHFFSWITSLTMTSVASSATLVSTTPLFAALFATLFFGEKHRPRVWWGIAGILLGSGFVAGADISLSGRALAGDGLALLGALMATGYFMAGRTARTFLDLTTYATLTYASAALILLVCCALSRTPLWGFAPRTYTMLILLALIPQLVGHTVFNWALKFLSPAAVAAFILGEPIGATLLAVLFLGEKVTFSKGMGLCLLGAAIVWTSHHLRAHSHAGRVEVDTTEEKK